MTDFGLKKLFARYWGVLLAISAVLSVALCLGIEFKTKPSSRETFSLFMDFAYGSVKTDAMERRIKEIDPALKKINAYSYGPSASGYQTYYSSWAANSDLLLLSEEYLDKKDMSEFVSLNSLEASNTYKVDGISYGLKANLTENDYFSLPNGAYYCFFRKDSVHLGGLSETGQSGLSLTIAKELFHVL